MISFQGYTFIESGKVKNIQAPKLAIQYYKLGSNAKLSDLIRCVRADEEHHSEIINSLNIKDVIDRLFIESKYMRGEKDNIFKEGEFSQGIMGSPNPAMSIQNNSAEEQSAWNRMP